jgi:hypothetical protein
MLVRARHRCSVVPVLALLGCGDRATTECPAGHEGWDSDNLPTIEIVILPDDTDTPDEPVDTADTGGEEPRLNEFGSFLWYARFVYDNDRDAAVYGSDIFPEIVIEFATEDYFQGRTGDLCEVTISAGTELRRAPWQSAVSSIVAFQLTYDDSAVDISCNYEGYDSIALNDSIDRVWFPGAVFGWTVQEEWDPAVETIMESWGVDFDEVLPGGVYRNDSSVFDTDYYSTRAYSYAFLVDEDMELVLESSNPQLLTEDDRFESGGIATAFWVVRSLDYWTFL